MLYPLKFKPIYKERLWGGSNIQSVLKRDLQQGSSLIGEAWDIVDREQDQSVVINGSLAGKTISQLRETFGISFLGTTLNPQEPFPILVKILDAKEDLSLQVHPKQKDLQYLPKDASPKTEFWYILHTKPNATIMYGLKSNDRDGFTEHLKKPTLKDYVNIYNPTVNDLFYIQSGTVHAIGAGNLLLEIQQNSDTTYRLSDWGRFDMHGNPRELHISSGLICIDFDNQPTTKPDHINLQENKQIVYSELFNTSNTFVDKKIQKNISTKSCEIISLTYGKLKVTSNDESIILQKGESAILPAGLKVDLQPHNCDSASFLSTIPNINK